MFPVLTDSWSASVDSILGWVLSHHHAQMQELLTQRSGIQE